MEEEDYYLDSDVAERNFLAEGVRLQGDEGIDITRLRNNEAVEFEVSDPRIDMENVMQPTSDADAYISAQTSASGGEPFAELGEKMTNVIEDGGIKKLIQHEGVGETIQLQCYATVHYKAVLEYNDEPYDSTRLRGFPLKFIVGEGEVFPGFDKAVSTMKKREIAQFLIEPRYHLGERGCPPRVPGGATVLFTIELLDFTEVGGVEAFYRMPVTERREVEFDVIKKVVAKEKKEAQEKFDRKAHRQAARHYQKAIKALEEYHLKDDEEENMQQEMLLKQYTNLAICHSHLHQAGSVIKFANQALAIKKTHIKALYHKAKALQALGDFARAHQVLQEALRIEPNNKDIKKQLVSLNKDTEKFALEEKLACRRMFNNVDDTAERARKNAREKEIQVEACTDEFKALVLEKLKEFKEDEDIMELPFPQKDLSTEEKSCINQTATELGLTIEQRSQDCVRILKPIPSD